MSNPATRIVSLTVTEGGYFLDGEGAFDRTNRDIVHDVQNQGAPRTTFGAILSALTARKAAGNKPFTVMSCDNLPGNGDITREVVVGMANAMDTDFGKWVDDNVTFPNGMVDRITPATGASERRLMTEKFGVDDKFPVFCEPFRQWVLEDKFVDGRPELDAVGVTFTNDIESFEMMKLRILNGGHAILAYASAMLGIDFTHDAMATPLVRAYLREVLLRDVVPYVHAVPGFTPDEYLDLICDRFSNPGVADTISRLCYDGSNRQPKFIVGFVRDNIAAGKSPDGLALCSALWCQYCLGRTDSGDEIASNDPNWDKLQKTARLAQLDSDAWLEQDEIYGSAGRDPLFRQAFAIQMTRLQANGTEETIRAYLNASNQGQS